MEELLVFIQSIATGFLSSLTIGPLLVTVVYFSTKKMYWQSVLVLAGENIMRVLYLVLYCLFSKQCTDFLSQDWVHYISGPIILLFGIWLVYDQNNSSKPVFTKMHPFLWGASLALIISSPATLVVVAGAIIGNNTANLVPISAGFIVGVALFWAPIIFIVGKWIKNRHVETITIACEWLVVGAGALITIQALL